MCVQSTHLPLYLQSAAYRQKFTETVVKKRIQYLLCKLCKLMLNMSWWAETQMHIVVVVCVCVCVCVVCVCVCVVCVCVLCGVCVHVIFCPSAEDLSNGYKIIKQ